MRWVRNLAKNLKAKRTKLKLSQQALAERSKLSIGTITRVEQGIIENPTLDTIEALGNGLNMPDPLDLLRR